MVETHLFTWSSFQEAELIRQRVLWLEHRLEKIVAENSSKSLFKKFQVNILLVKRVHCTF